MISHPSSRCASQSLIYRILAKICAHFFRQMRWPDCSIEPHWASSDSSHVNGVGNSGLTVRSHQWEFSFRASVAQTEAPNGLPFVSGGAVLNYESISYSIGRVERVSCERNPGDVSVSFANTRHHRRDTESEHLSLWFHWETSVLLNRHQSQRESALHHARSGDYRLFEKIEMRLPVYLTANQCGN